MPPRPVPPSINSVAFSCPHCGAFADQFWYQTFARSIEDHGTPTIADSEMLEFFSKDKSVPAQAREKFVADIKREMTGEVYLEKQDRDLYKLPSAKNLALSQCHSCNKYAVWIYDRLVYPPTRVGVEPNEDLSPEVLRDFNEARSIVDASPRGAAALLRLSIQKLCAELGAKGNTINDQIGDLVTRGLDARIQKSLDIVRVVGNEAVHPGEIDLRDDRDTAVRLFDLVNLVADRMITQEKQVATMYKSLPESKRKGIELRDKPKP